MVQLATMEYNITKNVLDRQNKIILVPSYTQGEDMLRSI